MGVRVTEPPSEVLYMSVEVVDDFKNVIKLTNTIFEISEGNTVFNIEFTVTTPEVPKNI